MKIQKAINFIISSVFVFLFVAIVFYVFPKAIKLLLPFIIAYLISFIITPFANELHYKYKVPKRIAIIILMLLIISSLILIFFNVIYQAVFAMQNLSHILPDIFYGNSNLPKWMQRIYDLYLRLPTTKQVFFDNIFLNIKNNLSNFLQPATSIALTAAKNIALSIPNFFIFTTVVIIATYFICADKEKIEKIIFSFIPKNVKYKIKTLKTTLKKALGGYVSSQAILMCINFAILLTGFLIIKIKYSFLMAAVISFVDALPVFGSGFVLIPWAAFNVLSGNYKIGITLLVFYITLNVVRQFLEPKIMGSKLGVHPLLMLVFMFAAFKIIGFFGLILGPVSAIIFAEIYKSKISSDENIAKCDKV